MPEAVAACFVAWLLLAAASFRFRRQLGIDTPAAVRWLRVAAAACLAIATVRCGGSVDGERWVRFLGTASIAGLVVVGLLSVAPAWTMRPVACLLRMMSPRLIRPAYFASRPSSIAARSKTKSKSGSGAS